MCLYHLVRQRYVEGTITDSNMEDLVAAAVRWNVCTPSPTTHVPSPLPSVCIRSRPGLQYQLVRELIHRGELHDAARWAAAYGVPRDTLPLSVQFTLMSQTLRPADDTGERREREKSPTEYLQLPLSLDSVHFVNTERTLRECQHRLAKVCGHGVYCGHPS